jgi:hypothetical protein
VTDISFFDTAAQRVSCTVDVEFEEAASAGAQIHSRLLRVQSVTGLDLQPGVQYLHQRLVAGKLKLSQSGPYDLLDNEIRIGLHLVRKFRSGPYPAELSRLVGYDVDADEPFALFLPYQGEQVRKVAGRLTLDQQREFEIGIFRALRLLAEATVVHGRLSPDTVHWDESSARVQVIDFSSAVLVGEQQTGSSSWNLSARPGDIRPATSADDVWSVGALTYYVVTGRHVDATAGAQGQNLRGHLQSLLDGVFADTPTARPSAVQLLRRLRVPDPWLGDDDADHLFAAGQREFDQIKTAKQASLARSFETTPAPAGPGKPRRRRRWPLLMLLAIIVVAVAALVREIS